MGSRQFTIRFVRGGAFAEVEQDNQLVFVRRGAAGESPSEGMKAFTDFDLANQFVREEEAKLLSEGYTKEEQERQTQERTPDREGDDSASPQPPAPLRIDGTHRDALEWIASSSLAEHRVALSRFVRRFPTLTFFRLEEDHSQVPKPQWLREMERTCCGFAPGQLKWLRFGRRGPWYHWTYTTALGSEHRRVFLGETMLLIICAVIDDHPVLALKLGNDDDRRVYEFDWEEVTTRGRGDGALGEEHLTARFDSLADLLAGVEAIRLEDGSVIRAARE